jgi:hypothetical protein
VVRKFGDRTNDHGVAIVGLELLEFGIVLHEPCSDLGTSPKSTFHTASSSPRRMDNEACRYHWRRQAMDE